MEEWVVNAHSTVLFVRGLIQSRVVPKQPPEVQHRMPLRCRHAGLWGRLKAALPGAPLTGCSRVLLLMVLLLPLLPPFPPVSGARGVLPATAHRAQRRQAHHAPNMLIQLLPGC
jgi:hypothetical protein